MSERVWTNEILDGLKHDADPTADAIAAAFLDGDESAGPASFFRTVGNSRYRLDEDDNPLVRAWFDQQPPLPDWVRPDALARGARFFSEFGLDIGMGLFLASLPTAYAAADGVKVLALTGRLETDAKQRIMETGQFLLDVTEPGALEPGGDGYTAARHVRLMHAGVRHLILTHPRVDRTETGSITDRWPDSLGEPVNQEFLIGTLISFSFTMLQVLDTMGVKYDQDGADDFVHLWNVVGHLIGIREDLLPFDIDDLTQLDQLIRTRNFRPSPEGRELTADLLEVLREIVPRWFASVPPNLMRLFMGDRVADIIGIPKKGWSAWLLVHARPALRVLSFVQAHSRLMRGLARRTARLTWQGFIDYESRGRGRPAFSIPENLAASWHVRLSAAG